jgi:hypothetical protein
MFLWSIRQVIVFFIMLCVCAMALTHPAWEHWYRVIFRPLFLAAAILALGYILWRK